MEEYDSGKIVPIDINQEMKNSFLDYAMSVIVSRAIPDVRDGLKPVHRRILYAMYDLGLGPDKSYKKSARVVGEVLGKYHPHGDVAVYDAMVRMAQDFNTRYPMVNGHGNFGSVDGDKAAAMRYTEVRMENITMELLRDIEKDTVDFLPNFDETLQEPEVLPSRFPNLLVNGSSGIAVGMATNIPPHNLGEVIDGIINVIDNPEITTEELRKDIRGPDFPTGGVILEKEGIKSAYESGKGTIKIRAKVEIEELKGNKNQIIVYEIPYQVNKSKLIENIADLVREKRVDGINDLRDESDRNGLRIVIELKRDANPRTVLNRLYKFTTLQQTFGMNMLALVDGQPNLLSLKEVLAHYVEYQKNIVIRRTRYLLNKAERRAHILEGLRIALDHIDEIIELIRNSETVDKARNALIERYELSERQAQAILDMRLQKLTGLERDKIENEYKELLETIKKYKEILADENLTLDIVKEELLDIKERFADDRRTIITEEDSDFEKEDLIKEEDVAVILTHRGYIKRLPLTTYKSQRRGGRGISGIKTRDDDFVEHLFVTSSHNYILFFTNRGKVFHLKVYEIPQTSRQSRGMAIVNLLNLEVDEMITAVIPIKDFSEGNNLIFATKKGIVKKTKIEEFKVQRKRGLIAINLDEDDELINVCLTDDSKEVIFATRRGKAIRFDEREVRSTGRNARGVKGISLGENDEVVGLDIVKEDSYLLVVSENGFGKRTSLLEYKTQSRGGKGIYTFKITNRTGNLTGVKIVTDEDDVMVVTAIGVIIRLDVSGISKMNRQTQGVKLIKLADNDRVVNMTTAHKEE